MRNLKTYLWLDRHARNRLKHDGAAGRQGSTALTLSQTGIEALQPCLTPSLPLFLSTYGRAEGLYEGQSIHLPQGDSATRCAALDTVLSEAV